MADKLICPRCKKGIYGYQWTKTKSGKNWLADKEGNMVKILICFANIDI